MSLVQLKENLEMLGYSAPVEYRRWEDAEVVYIDQELSEIDDFGFPVLKTFGYVWFKNRTYFMNYRYRIPHPLIKEFRTIDEIIALVLEEFPLIEK